MPESCHQKFKGEKKRIVLFHETAFIASTNQTAKIFCTCELNQSACTLQTAPSPTTPPNRFFFAMAGNTDTPPRPAPPVSTWMSQLQTWLTPIFIFISTLSNHTRLSWHSSISVSSIRTHMWGLECLTCMWNIGPYTCFLNPILRHDPTQKLFNFHALKKKISRTASL